MAYRSSSDSSKFPEQDDRAYNALMHEVQQKFLWHREHTSARLQKIEDMLELAVHKLSLIRQVQQEHSAEEGFINPSGCPKTEKQHSECKSAANKKKSLLHPNLRFPKFKEGSVVLETAVGIGNKTDEWPHPTEGNVDRKDLEAYQESPRYDEVPGEDKEDWHYEELICIALGVENFFKPKQNFEGNSTGAKVWECISDCGKPSPSVFPAAIAYVPRKVPDEVGSVGNLLGEQVKLAKLFGVNYLFDCSLETKRFHKNTKRKTILVTENEIGDELNSSITKEEIKEDSDMTSWFSGQGDMPKIVGSYKVEKRQGANVVSSMIFTNMREIVEALLSKRIDKECPTADIPYGLGMKSCNFGKGNMLIFDPGGQMQNKKPKGVDNKFKVVIRSEGKLEAAVMKISIGGQLRHWQDISLNFLAIKQLVKEPSQLQRKVFIVEIRNPARLQGHNSEKVNDRFDHIVSAINQHDVDSVKTGMIALHYKFPYMVLEQGRPEMKKSMSPEYHQASKKSVTRYIFDPGGDLSCLQGVLLGVSTGIPNIQQPLQDFLKKKTYTLKEKQLQGLNHYPRCMKTQSVEVQD